MSHIIHLDYKIFFFINHVWTSHWMDVIFPWIRNKYLWAPFYAYLITYLVVNYKKKGWLLLLFMILLIVVTDQLSSEFLKPWVGRLRPCQDNQLEFVRLLVNCSKSYSFPSSHASNHFALSFFLIGIFGRKYKWIIPLLFLWAFAISYAQVYVGVHYPLDIFAGMLLGIALGLTFAALAGKILYFEP